MSKKYALITKDHTVVTSKARSGGHRGEMDFKAGPDPVPVTQAQLEALLAANAAEEVAAPAAAPEAKADGKADGKAAASSAAKA